MEIRGSEVYFFFFKNVEKFTTILASVCYFSRLHRFAIIQTTRIDDKVPLPKKLKFLNKHEFSLICTICFMYLYISSFHTILL